MLTRLRCYVMRYRIVDLHGADQSGVLTVIHRSEDAALGLLYDHFANKARSVVTVTVRQISLVETAYLDSPQ